MKTSFPIRLLLVLMAVVSARANEKSPGDEDADWKPERQAMVDLLRTQYEIKDPKILAAMGKVRRHRFIPPAYRQHHQAYGDFPGPIGYDQTISQPYIVAFMTEQLRLQEGEKVLEIGTGSGYQAAILAECGAEVYTIEIVPELAKHAQAVLAAEGYQKVYVLADDGYKGWPDQSPFDAIIITCAPEEVPQALVQQLKEGGRMILPLGGTFYQRLVILRKKGGQVETEESLSVRFVPMVREKK